MILNLLSVNEDEGRTDRISAVQYEFAHQRPMCVKFSVTENGALVIKKAPTSTAFGTEVSLNQVDIDGMIDFLQQAKTFISEKKLMNTLSGHRDQTIYY